MSLVLRSSSSKPVLVSWVITAFTVLLFCLNQTSAAAQETSQPSKEALIETLNKVVQQLELKQYAETEKYFYLPPRFEQRMFERLISKKVISRAGVVALSKGGEYGKAIGVTRKSNVEEVADEFKVPADECYAMKMKQGDENCLVIAHWTGGYFKILELERIGTMDPDKVVAIVAVPVKPWPTGEVPTKELFIETLQVFLHQIQNKHYEATRPNVYVPDNFVMSRFHDSLERQEISLAGIDVLAKQGDFGKAVDVFAKLRAESLTERVQVPVEECFGLIAKVGGVQGEALGHWVGDRFKLLRADDIGKLPDALLPDVGKDRVAEAGKMAATIPGSAGLDQQAAQPPSGVGLEKEATETPQLPKYETDQAVVMSNYPAMMKAVAESPNDASLRAKFVQNLLVIGNTPGAWKEAREIYRLAPQNVEVIYAVDQCIEGLKKNGIFQVGVAKETFEALLGKPDKETIDGEIVRWEYPIWNIDFNQGRFVKLTRTMTAPAAAVVAGAKTSGSVELPDAGDMKATPKPLFNLKLISFDRKIRAVQLIRAERELSLKETVKLIGDLPVVVLEGLSREDAEAVKERFAEKNVVTEIVEAITAKEDPVVKTPVDTKVKVELSSFGSNKIAVIKVIRKLRKGMSLRDAKELVENTPAIVLEGVTKEEAAVALELLQTAGASAEVK